MKKFLLLSFLACILASVSANAQDVIVKTDNSTILSKVEEISAESIKYRKWDNLDGPVYVLNISEVISINYSNGTMETFKDKQKDNVEVKTEETISVSQTPQIGNVRVAAENNIDFLRRDDLLKSARGYKIGSIVCISAGIVIAVIPGIAYVVGAASEGAMIAGVCVGLGTTIFGGGILKGKSIKLQREAYEIAKADIVEMKLGDTNAYASLCSTYNPVMNKSNVGVGLAIRF